MTPGPITIQGPAWPSYIQRQARTQDNAIRVYPAGEPGPYHLAG